MTPEPWTGVTLARVVRPHGRSGEVAAEILTDFPERLQALREAYLWDGAAPPRRVAVRSCWLTRRRTRQAVFHFAGSDSIGDAQQLTGLQVQVPLEERAALPPGRYYITDLIGCQAWEQNAATPLGIVRDVIITGEEIAGTPVLAVETPAGELLVPFAMEICRVVDLASRRLEIVLPEGLRDLNP